MTRLSPRPRTLPRVLGLLALLSAVVLVAALAVAAALTSQAQTVQLVQPEAEAVSSLFGGAGGPGTPIGSPQRLIIRDSAAFLPGQTADGARYVSDPYLKAHGLYPLQVKTVEVVRTLVALVAAAGLLVFGGLWWWVRR